MLETGKRWIDESKDEEISVSLVSMPTMKPFDIESIKKFILRDIPIISFKTFKCVILWILYDLVYPKKLGKFL